jgi:hypothetical protein
MGSNRNTRQKLTREPGKIDHYSKNLIIARAPPVHSDAIGTGGEACLSVKPELSGAIAVSARRCAA